MQNLNSAYNVNMKEAVNSKVVGDVIRQFRKRKRLSQEILSGFAGIARVHLSMIERGERKPTLETLFKLANALEVNPSEIVSEIEQNNKRAE